MTDNGKIFDDLSFKQKFYYICNADCSKTLAGFVMLSPSLRRAAFYFFKPYERGEDMGHKKTWFGSTWKPVNDKKHDKLKSS